MAGGANPFMPPGAAGSGGAPIGGGPVIGASQPARPSGAAMPPRNGRTPLEQTGATLQVQYKDGMKAQQVLDHLRVELDQLMDMGDVVRPEHVIEAAGRLVGHGIGATQLAQIMSDMPSVGGEGLASWIRMHDMTVSQAETQLMQENNLLRHRMGVTGLRMMAEQHIGDRLQMHAQNAQAAAQSAAQQAGPNALMGAVSGAGSGNGEDMGA